MNIRSNEKRLREIFKQAVGNFSKAGFKIKDAYIDDFELEIKEREQRIENIKNNIGEEGADSLLNAYRSMLSVFNMEDTESDDDNEVMSNIEDHIDHMEYNFNTPYLALYFPEDAILIPILANNLPSIMQLEIFQGAEELDYSSTDAEFANCGSFLYNHSGRRPDIFLSIMEPLVDQRDPENYYKARALFIEGLFELSIMLLESYTQWRAAMDFLNIQEKTKPSNKGVNIDITKSDNKEE